VASAEGSLPVPGLPRSVPKECEPARGFGRGWRTPRASLFIYKSLLYKVAI